MARKFVSNARWILSNPWDAWPVWKEYRKLQESERWQPARLATVQHEKLSRLYAIAIASTDYYRERKLAHLRLPKVPEELGEWLEQWPILSKEEVRAHFKEMLSPVISERSRRYVTTGGSTGQPLRVAKSVSTVAVAEAALVRGQLWAGVSPGDPGLSVKTFGRISLLGRARQMVANRMSISAYGAQKNGRRNLAEQVRRFRPRFVTGYPTSLLHLAQSLRGKGVKIPVVLSTGEMLQESQRASLAETFEACVFDYYGSNEVGSLAYECEHGARHITEEHVILETVDGGGKSVSGVPGRILITDLDNYALPLIRYDVGDIGVLGNKQCSCGRALRVLNSLEGRTQDMLQSRSGKSLPAIFFAGRFRSLTSLKAYQLIQKSWETVELRYVVGAQNAPKEVQEIVDEVMRHLGPEVSVQTNECAEIPLTARGKTRLVVGCQTTSS